MVCMNEIGYCFSMLAKYYANGPDTQCCACAMAFVLLSMTSSLHRTITDLINAAIWRNVQRDIENMYVLVFPRHTTRTFSQIEPMPHNKLFIIHIWHSRTQIANVRSVDSRLGWRGANMLLKSSLSSIHKIQGDRLACRNQHNTPNCAHTNALKIHSKPHQIHETHTRNVLFQNGMWSVAQRLSCAIG